MKLRYRIALLLVLGAAAVVFAASPQSLGPVFRLANVALASFPTASALNEGGLLYDSTNKVVKFSNATVWSTPIATLGGNPNEVQYNSGGTTLGGISNATTDGVVLRVGDDAGTPAAPTTGFKFFGRAYTGWEEVRVLPPRGPEYSLQPSLGSQSWSSWVPSGSTTMGCAGSYCSTGTVTSAGTLSSPIAVTNGDDWVWRPRTRLATAAGGGSSAYVVATGNASSVAPLVVGENSNQGGLYFKAQVNAGPAIVSTASFFVGVRANVGSSPGNVNPTQIVGGNTIFFGAEGASGNWNFCSAGGGQNAACVDLGSSFPIIDGGTAYTFRFYVPPGGPATDWYAKNEANGTEVFGQATAQNTPDSGVLLEPIVFTNNRGTAAATQLEVSNVYWQSMH